MRDVTISEIERLRAGLEEVDDVFEMDEASFGAFYDRTARPLWAYLARMTGRGDLADDLLQEAYFRFLRAGARHASEAHRRHSLFRIATNLARDGRRRARHGRLVPLPAEGSGSPELAAPGDAAADADRRTDLARAMARLKPRQRELLWLAYAQGFSHVDIAGATGVQAGSVRQLLFRARRRLAELLGRPSASAPARTSPRGPRSTQS